MKSRKPLCPLCVLCASVVNRPQLRTQDAKQPALPLPKKDADARMHDSTELVEPSAPQDRPGLFAAVREAGGDELRDVRVFDVLRGVQVGEGRKSVALHLAFQAPDRTPTDEEAAAPRERIVAALAERFGAGPRA